MILPYVYVNEEWHRQKHEMQKNSDMIEASFEDRYKLDEDWIEYPEYHGEGKISIDPAEVHHLATANETHTVIYFYDVSRTYTIPMNIEDLQRLLLQEMEKESNL